MMDHFHDIAAAVRDATKEDLALDESWDTAAPKLVRAFEALKQQRYIAVKALADAVHKELAPATAEMLGKRIVSPERLAEFFNKIAHSNESHRKWLRDEFNSFWAINIPPPATQFEEHIWRSGCNYQSDGFCNKCGDQHKQTYKEAHGDNGPLAMPIVESPTMQKGEVSLQQHGRELVRGVNIGEGDE